MIRAMFFAHRNFSFVDIDNGMQQFSIPEGVIFILRLFGAMTRGRRWQAVLTSVSHAHVKTWICRPDLLGFFQ